MEPLFLILMAIGLSEGSPVFKSSMEAFYKQTGADRMVQQYGERQFSREARARIGTAATLVQSVTQQRVEFRWEF